MSQDKPDGKGFDDGHNKGIQREEDTISSSTKPTPKKNQNKNQKNQKNQNKNQNKTAQQKRSYQYKRKEKPEDKSGYIFRPKVPQPVIAQESQAPDVAGGSSTKEGLIPTKEVGRRVIVTETSISVVLVTGFTSPDKKDTTPVLTQEDILKAKLLAEAQREEEEKQKREREQNETERARQVVEDREESRARAVSEPKREKHLENTAELEQEGTAADKAGLPQTTEVQLLPSHTPW